MSAHPRLAPDVAEEAISLRELDERQVRLDAQESRFLLSEHAKHLDLRPALDDREAWRVRPAGWCGSIPLPSGRVIYIEPKVGIARLWRMLVWAYDLLELSAQAPVPFDVADLVESVVEVFVRRVEDLQRQGLLRGYVSRQENLYAMRGRLNVAGHLRTNAVARHRLLCDYDDFTTDIPENRIIRRTLHLLLRTRAWRPRVRLPMDRCERRMGEGDLRHITERDFAEVHFTRLNAHYRTPLMLARLLLEMLSVTHRFGEREMLPLLLRMPGVFERFLQRMLGEGLAPEGLTVRWDGERRHLDCGRSVVLRPDMVIAEDGHDLCIADAKYKETAWDADAGDEQAATAARPADVYQMLAYCIGYGVSDAVLVYAEPTTRETIEIAVDGRLVRVHSLGIDLAGDSARFGEACTRLSGALAGIAMTASAAVLREGV